MIQTWQFRGTRIGNPAPWHEATAWGWGEIGMRPPPKPANKGGSNTRCVHAIDGESLTSVQIERDPRNTLRLARKAITSRITRALKAGRVPTWRSLQRVSRWADARPR